MLSMGIAMMVIAIFVGNEQISPELFSAFITAMKVSMAIFAGLCIAGIFFSLVRYSRDGPGSTCKKQP
jgi:ABC-type proline/glycine betaine transport system permease subunit